jgi:cytochrome c biogenesis protein CcdA
VIALAIGLALSFMIVGIILATLGTSLGLDPDTFRTIGALVLALFGLVLLVPKLQDLFAHATRLFSNSGASVLARMTVGGLAGQLCVGLLLGVVWSPCVGPTLGAATTLASQGRNLAQIGLLMLVFGVGAAAPLALLGSLSRATMMKIRGRLLSGGKVGKQILGGVVLALGLMIATGVDKTFEAWILDHSPEWLTAATTKY